MAAQIVQQLIRFAWHVIFKHLHLQPGSGVLLAGTAQAIRCSSAVLQPMQPPDASESALTPSEKLPIRSSAGLTEAKRTECMQYAASGMVMMMSSMSPAQVAFQRPHLNDIAIEGGTEQESPVPAELDIQHLQKYAHRLTPLLVRCKIRTIHSSQRTTAAAQGSQHCMQDTKKA